jgi:hypothetical protein
MYSRMLQWMRSNDVDGLLDNLRDRVRDRLARLRRHSTKGGNPALTGS